MYSIFLKCFNVYELTLFINSYIDYIILSEIIIEYKMTNYIFLQIISVIF